MVGLKELIKINYLGVAVRTGLALEPGDVAAGVQRHVRRPRRRPDAHPSEVLAAALLAAGNNRPLHVLRPAERPPSQNSVELGTDRADSSCIALQPGKRDLPVVFGPCSMDGVPGMEGEHELVSFARGGLTEKVISTIIGYWYFCGSVGDEVETGCLEGGLDCRGVGEEEEEEEGGGHGWSEV